ncbi:MAG: hypothetical protein U0234_06845 [Sandaracinus sp.]
MSVQDLTNEEVLHHTEAFVTAGRAENTAVSASVLARAYLPVLVRARGDLARPLGGSPEVARITQHLFDEDQRVHDPLARGVHAILSAGEDVLPSPGLGAGCGTLKRALFADGLSIIKKSYVETSGAVAARLRIRAEPNYAPMFAIAFETTTIGAIVDRWNASGQRIGELHRQRAALTGEETDPTAADVLEAKRLCIRIVDAIEGAMKLEGVAEDTRTTTFRGWNEAVHVATQRAKAVVTGTDGTPTPSPAPAGG